MKEYDTNSLIKTVYEIHKNNFPYKDKDNKRVAIIYSATSWMWKSTLTKKIYNKFNPNIIENDCIKDILNELWYDWYSENMNIFVKIYVKWLFEEIETKRNNKFIIFDLSCDRKYDLIKSLCDKFDVKLFVIRFSVSLEEAIERVSKRENNWESKEHKKQLIEKINNKLRPTYLEFGERNIDNIFHYNWFDDEENIYKFIKTIIM